jgi:hypothetical protein
MRSCRIRHERIDYPGGHGQTFPASRRGRAAQACGRPPTGRVAGVADDDWRVTVTLADEADVRQAVQSVREHEVEEDVRRRLGDRIAVSADGPSIFLYAGTEEAAREADRLVRDVLAQRQLTGSFALDRWHPVEEKWEDATVPLPQSSEERQAERERRIADETQESLATGDAEWQVIVELPSRHAAVKLAERLDAEGRSVIRRWNFLFVGANNEDEAADLATVIRQEAPASASVQTSAVLFAEAELAQAELSDSDENS